MESFRFLDLCATAHTTLDTAQLTSHTRTALVDTVDSLQGSNGDVIPVSEVNELLTEIHDIPDNALSKWIGNTTNILAYLFNSTSRQCHEV